MEDHATQQADGASSYAGSLGKYLVVYCIILCLAGLQFLIGHAHASVPNLIFRMMAIAFLEAGLAIIFFMHMGSENRTFVVWVAVITLFVFAALQYSWTDSFRMERDAPRSSQTGPPQSQ